MIKHTALLTIIIRLTLNYQRTKNFYVQIFLKIFILNAVTMFNQEHIKYIFF